MGNTAVSAKLRADIHFNCMEDVISLNTTAGKEKGINYTTEGGQPIVSYSELQKATTFYTFNLFDRFVQIGNSTICPFSDFRIDYVLAGLTGNNVTNNNTFFRINSAGEFTIR
jgi:hypothetical protein